MIIEYKSNIKHMGAFVIKYNYSSLIETENFYGVSHLIEHCMCDSIQDFENKLFINGLNYNGYTSSRNIIFFIEGLDKNIKKFSAKFYDIVVNSKITEECFERQKKIVIQELMNYQADQHSVFAQNLKRKYFNCPEVGGELTNLENLTYEKFMTYKNTYVNVPDEIILTTNYKLSDEEQKLFQTTNRNLQTTTFNFNKNGYNTFSLIDGPAVDDNRIVKYVVPYKSTASENYEHLIYYNVFEIYMNQGLTSPLYDELRNKHKYVYSINSYSSEVDMDNYAWITTLQTTNENMEKAKKTLVKCFQHEIKHLSKRHFNIAIKILKNKIKTTKYTSHIRTNTLSENIFYAIETFKFDFEKFKKYVNEFINSEYILIDDISIKAE